MNKNAEIHKRKKRQLIINIEISAPLQPHSETKVTLTQLRDSTWFSEDRIQFPPSYLGRWELVLGAPGYGDEYAGIRELECQEGKPLQNLYKLDVL